MDTYSLIREAKARFNHQESRRYLLEKYTAQLSFPDQGGLWTANTTLITFLRTQSQETVILLDNYNKPVKVQVSDLLEKAQQVYDSVMEAWLEEFEELRTRR